MRTKVDCVLVCLGEKLVGTLAETANHRAAFEYSPEWLETGFTISPFSLPLEKRVYIPEKLTFDGLFGVFADSLPDSWGQLLVDRMLQRRGYDPENVFSHNRDDHAKNFSFLYDDIKDIWHLSPAYDLTWSSTYFGEHTTTVDGNGRNPEMRELINVGTRAGLGKRKCIELAERVREQTGQLVRIWGNRPMA